MLIIPFTLYTEPVLTFSPRHQRELAEIVQTGLPDVIVAAAELGDEETLRNYLNKNPHEVLTGVRRIFALAKEKNSNQALLTEYCVRGHTIITSHLICQIRNTLHCLVLGAKILLLPVAIREFGVTVYTY